MFILLIYVLNQAIYKGITKYSLHKRTYNNQSQQVKHKAILEMKFNYYDIRFLTST